MNSERFSHDDFADFMIALENAGILKGWSDFMKKKDEPEQKVGSTNE